jgi:hypothetical protein
MSDTTSYWIEIARHPEGYVLFDCFKDRAQLRSPWIRLKLMRPQVPGRRIARRVWLQWNADEQRLSRTPLADELPKIYEWVHDVLEGLAVRETSGL